MPELFYDGSQDPEFIAQLEAEQADSEQLGEQIQEAESQRLAGKFESAEELERAYLELQTLLGKKSGDSTEDEYSEEDPQEDDETKDEEDDEFDAAAVVAALNEEYAASGTLSQETIDNLQQLSPLDVAALFLQAGVVQPQATEPKALTKQEADAFINLAGGEQQYNAIVTWGRENYAPEEVEAFNEVINSGYSNSIYFAILALKSRYAEAEGADGRQLTRTRPSSSRGDVFRSQAEVQRAMNDPRYDEDPAYRQDVFERLSRSNLDYD